MYGAILEVPKISHKGSDSFNTDFKVITALIFKFSLGVESDRLSGSVRNKILRNISLPWGLQPLYLTNFSLHPCNVLCLQALSIFLRKANLRKELIKSILLRY